MQGIWNSVRNPHVTHDNCNFNSPRWNSSETRARQVLPMTPPREKSMPVAKHLPYPTSRPRTGRSRLRRIDAPSFTGLPIDHDQAPCARPQRTSSKRPAISAAGIASRSFFRTAAQYAGAAGEILLAIASWMATAMLEGSAVYALAMYGMPDAVGEEEVLNARPSASGPLGSPSHPALRLVSAGRE
jgi:hypothetical protein